MTAFAADPGADVAGRLGLEVERRPYFALLAAGGLGWLLAGGLALRVLPGLLSLGIRVALVCALPTLTALVREVASPDP